MKIKRYYVTLGVFGAILIIVLSFIAFSSLFKGSNLQNEKDHTTDLNNSLAPTSTN
ncbi:MAG: hypothetical protein WCI52_03760 [bacterium]